MVSLVRGRADGSEGKGRTEGERVVEDEKGRPDKHGWKRVRCGVSISIVRPRCSCVILVIFVY